MKLATAERQVRLLVMRVLRALFVAVLLAPAVTTPLTSRPAAAESDHGESTKKQRRATKKIGVDHPVVSAFVDCVLDYARRNATASTDDVTLVHQAENSVCSQRFTAVVELSLVSFYSDAQRSEFFRRIGRSIFGPLAVARKAERDRIADIERRGGDIAEEQAKAVADCVVGKALLSADSTSESAEAITIAAIEQCRAVIHAAALKIAENVAERFPDTTVQDRQQFTTKTEDYLSDKFKTSAITAVVEERSHSSKPAEAKAEGPSSGSGIVIAPMTILTNAHVVKDCEALSVKNDAGTGSAQAIDVDDARDLAIVRYSGAGYAFAKFRTSFASKIGETVYVFGYPLTGALSSNGNFTTGLVSALEGIGNDPHYLQISAPVQPGNSGGPLLDSHGNLLGVVTAKLDALVVAGRTGDIPQNVNFAIRLDQVQEFLKSRGIAYSEAETSVGDLPATSIASLARLFSVQIFCTP